MALRLAQGSYTGNGSDNRDITVTPSFVIKQVIITANSAQPSAMALSGMSGNSVKLESNLVTPTANIIQSMGTGTFQVGTDATVNSNGVTYYYLCIGGDDTEVVVGSYNGNNVDGRQITTNFQPEYVVIVSETTNDPITSRFGAIAGDNSIGFSDTADTLGTDYIQALNATGFEVGASVNYTGGVFHYIAIKNVSGQSFTSNYTGNGSDNRDITDPGFQPEAVIIKGKQRVGTWRGTAMSGDLSAPWTSGVGGLYANGIQSLISTGFQIGTISLVNDNAAIYYYYALKDNPVVGPANLKTVDDLASASIKTVDGLAIASVKTFNGLS